LKIKLNSLILEPKIMRFNTVLTAILWIFCSFSPVFAQKTVKTVYYNADSDTVQTKAEATHYLVLQTNGKSRVTTKYSATDVKLEETAYRKGKPKSGVGDSVWWKYGSFRVWYPTGELEAEGSYILDLLHDNLKTYYPNGVLRRNDVYYIDTLRQAHCYAHDGSEIPHIPYQVQPEFKGGQGEMFRFLGETIVYPLESRQEGTEGTVYVGFWISKTGVVENVKIRIGVDKNLDKEALRVVKSMPNWKPGKQEGEPVRIRFTLPVRFKLTN
jgi:periplasmic protein TonB